MENDEFYKFLDMVEGDKDFIDNNKELNNDNRVMDILIDNLDTDYMVRAKGYSSYDLNKLVEDALEIKNRLEILRELTYWIAYFDKHQITFRYNRANGDVFYKKIKEYLKTHEVVKEYMHDITYREWLKNDD